MERWEISSEDEDYPKELLLLNHPPEIIYGMGDISVLQQPCMSVIGARRATPYGMAIAEMAGRCAADNNIVVDLAELLAAIIGRVWLLLMLVERLL